jgi:hypothetical protein
VSEPGSYEYELARGIADAPVTRRFTFDLSGSVASRVEYEDLRQIVDLAAVMLASDTPVRILLRRMQAIRTFEQEG